MKRIHRIAILLALLLVFWLYLSLHMPPKLWLSLPILSLFLVAMLCLAVVLKSMLELKDHPK